MENSPQNGRKSLLAIHLKRDPNFKYVNDSNTVIYIMTQTIKSMSWQMNGKGRKFLVRDANGL